MIQAQTVIPDLAFLPRLFITVLFICLTGAVVRQFSKLLSWPRRTYVLRHRNFTIRRSDRRHPGGNWTSV